VLKRIINTFISSNIEEHNIFTEDRLYKFWPSTFTINSDYNGKKTNVGTAGQKLNIVFRSCPLEYYKQQPVKGFIAHVQSRGERRLFQSIFRYKTPQILQTI
jgi:hypothetical protein